MSEESKKFLTGNELAEYLKEAADEMKKYLPCMALHVSEEGSAVELYLDTAEMSYNECIPGEGADISLMRRESDGKVIGVRLPLYRKNLAVSHNGPIRINAGFRKGDTP